MNNIPINTSSESLVVVPMQPSVAQIRAQAIKTSLELLDIENVAFIVYVDDKFDISEQKGEFKGRLKSLKANNNYLSTAPFHELDWETPDQIFDKDIVQLWDDSENQSELLLMVCRHCGDEHVANVIPVIEMGQYYQERLITMTPEAWIKDEFNVLRRLDDKKRALCLFDFEFENSENRRDGAQLAKNLIEHKDFSERIVCGIFSHKFSEGQEDEFRLIYSDKYEIDKTKFYTISKERYTFDPQISGFAEGIKNLLLNPYVEKLKEESIKVLKESSEKAVEEINAITPNTFNHIVQKSSLKEGIWEIATLLRLYGVLSKEENYNIISDKGKRQSFNESIERIRNIDSKDTGYKTGSKNEQLISLRESDLYLKGDIVNKLHLPLSNGDIFEINGTEVKKGKEYILLVQPCNLALRAIGDNGKVSGKRDYKYDNAILVPIKSIEKNRLNITCEEIKLAESSNNFQVAYFPEFKILSLYILDLVVFNEDGKALIDMNIESLKNDVIHFPWKKRYDYIFSEFKKCENNIKSFNIGIDKFDKLIKQKKDEKIDTKELIELKNVLLEQKRNVFNVCNLKKI